MKKTLLLAAVLACSGVVQAEQFICTSERRTSLSYNQSSATNFLELGIKDLIYFVDTSRGFKLISNNNESEFMGVCSESENPLSILTCEEKSYAGIYTAMILFNENDEIHFIQTSLATNIQSGNAGSCIKI
jgi:hypothetical protein